MQNLEWYLADLKSTGKNTIETVEKSLTDMFIRLVRIYPSLYHFPDYIHRYSFFCPMSPNSADDWLRNSYLNILNLTPFKTLEAVKKRRWSNWGSTWIYSPSMFTEQVSGYMVHFNNISIFLETIAHHFVSIHSDKGFVD